MSPAEIQQTSYSVDIQVPACFVAGPADESWNSYPKVNAIGHPDTDRIFDGPVVVEEKIDGSQFSFGVFDGVLRCRSKGKEQDLDAPDKMFAPAIATARELAPLLVDGWTYRGEYLQKPKHNVLAYDRAPARHVMIFDIATGLERYLSYDDKAAEAARLGLEVVPRIYEGVVASADFLMGLVRRASVLGGQQAEGIVVKNHGQFGRDGKPLVGKFVTEAFKEVHRGTWQAEHGAEPMRDVITRIGDGLRTEARWNKAVQHLAERGAITDSPKDIGALIAETQRDIEEECGDEIKQALYAHARKPIMRSVVRGLPEWYKRKIAARAFRDETREAA